MPSDAVTPPKPITAPAGTIYATVPGIPATSGVALVQPPVGPIMSSVMKAVDEATSQLKPDENGGLVAVGNEAGVNLAIVQRAGKKFAVIAWIGRSWKGSLNYGAAVKKTW